MSVGLELAMAADRAAMAQERPQRSEREGVNVAAVEVLITLSDGQQVRLGTRPGDLIHSCRFENRAGLTLGPNVPASQVRRDGTRSLTLAVRWWEGLDEGRGGRISGGLDPEDRGQVKNAVSQNSKGG